MSLRVLLCDTDHRFVERASRFLAGHGHQVMSEPVAKDALEMARRWRPDVVVLSSELVDGPDSDWIEGLNALHPRPAVLLTGQLERFDAAWRAWRMGGDELLLKPVIHGWELHTAIVSALETTAARRPQVKTKSAASA